MCHYGRACALSSVYNRYALWRWAILQQEQQQQQQELAKSIVVCNEANAWDPEKTNGCSSAATAASGEMLTAAFHVSA